MRGIAPSLHCTTDSLTNEKERMNTNTNWEPRGCFVLCLKVNFVRWKHDHHVGKDSCIQWIYFFCTFIILNPIIYMSRPEPHGTQTSLPWSINCDVPGSVADPCPNKDQAHAEAINKQPQTTAIWAKNSHAPLQKIITHLHYYWKPFVQYTITQTWYKINNTRQQPLLTKRCRWLGRAKLSLRREP